MKMYIYAAAGVLLMGVSWYAYSTTKALGAAEAKNEQLRVSLDQFEERFELLNQAIAMNRKQHEKVERSLRKRIGVLNRVATQACFDDPIPDTAADIVRQLSSGDRVSEAPRSTSAANADP